MAELEAKSLDSPDEVREFVSNGRAEIVNLSSGAVGKGTFEPGWRWSEHVKPISGTDSCQVQHVGYVLSGRMKVVADVTIQNPVSEEGRRNIDLWTG